MDTLSIDIAERRRTGAFGWTRRAVERLAAADRQRRDGVRLAALPDHLLADIGLTRDAARSGRLNRG